MSTERLICSRNRAIQEDLLEVGIFMQNES